MEITFIQWIFLTLPESVALASLAVVLGSRNLEVKSIIIIGLPYAAAVYLVRLLPLTFGVHTIFLIIILSLLLNFVLKLKFYRSLFVALIGLIILAVSEGIFINILYSITGIPLEQARDNIILWVYYGLPHIIFLFMLAVAGNKWQQMRHIKKRGI